MTPPPGAGLSRREMLEWMASAAASVSWLACASWPERALVPAPIGTDPDLLDPVVPWPLSFSARQRAATRALCDLILPADERSPAASAVGVPEFVDEWVSAPYPAHRRDREIVVAGLDWVDAESERRHGARFDALAEVQQVAICDSIADARRVPLERREPARFFALLRAIALGAFYTTPEGLRDLGYVGNVPLASFDGPPPELLAHLGLDDDS